jgi:hypothetical protein
MGFMATVSMVGGAVFMVVAGSEAADSTAVAVAATGGKDDMPLR